jgi:hypothetical protein
MTLTGSALKGLLFMSLFALSTASTGCGGDEKTDPPIDTVADVVAADTAANDTDSDIATGDVVSDTGGGDAAEDVQVTDAATQDAGPVDVATDLGQDIQPPECTQPCDCDQGEGCQDGACVLGPEPVFCCAKEGCPEGAGCSGSDGTQGLCGIETSIHYGSLLFNEVLIDGAVDGDPNGDGDFPDSVGDEFVEIVNASADALDISGFTLVENTLPKPRHTFVDGTTVPAGHALVVFGGGTAPDDTASATFLTSNSNEGAIPFGLHLDNDGDTLRLLDKDGALVASFSYGVGKLLEAVTDESMTRNPDITGDWTAHSEAGELLFSPGTRVDGSEF